MWSLGPLVLAVVFSDVSDQTGQAQTKLRSDLEPAIRQMIEWMLAADLDTLGPGTYNA